MEFACSEAIPFKGRNKEYAMHVLQLVEYNIKVNTIFNVLYLRTVRSIVNLKRLEWEGILILSQKMIISVH